MCEECGMNPCHPRCPNAPEPVPVHECVKCGYGILAGDKFWDSPEGKICEECVDDMSAEEILKLLLESLKKKLNLRQRLQIKNILLYNRMNERRTLGGRKNGSSERAFKS